MTLRADGFIPDSELLAFSLYRSPVDYNRTELTQCTGKSIAC